MWQGALPTLFAATDPAARGGAYYGPDRLGGTRGYPAEEKPPNEALDTAVAARLWETSLKLTSVDFHVGCPRTLIAPISARHERH